MAFFRNRPLCVFCILWTSALLIASLCPVALSLAAVITGAALLFVLLPVSFFFPKRFRNRGARQGSFLRRLWALALLLCLPFLRFAFYASFRANAFDPYAQEACVTVDGRVTDVSYVSAYGASYVITTDRVNGSEARMKLYLELPSASLVRVGDDVTVSAVPEPFVNDGTFNEKSSAAADGVVGKVRAEEASCVTVTSLVPHRSFRSFWTGLNADMSVRLLDACGKRSGGLCAAVLLGRRDLLTGTAARDFSRSGISHVLALSGFHVSVLAVCLDTVLLKTRVGKGKRMVAVGAFLFLFLCVTGFLPSALRSVLMLYVLYLAKALFAENDTPTTLAVTVAAMMTVRPAFIFDLSLWMSYLATFGVLLGAAAAERLPRRGWIGRRFGGALGGVIVSLFAMICVLPISFVYFGNVSVWAPVMTLIATPLSFVILAGSGVTVLCSFVSEELGKAVGVIPEKAADLLLNVTGRASACRGTVFSLKYDFVLYIGISLLVFFLIWCFFKWNKKWLIAVPLLFSVGTYALCLSVLRKESTGLLTAYLCRGSSETLLISDEGQAVMVNIGNGALSDFTSGYRALENEGHTELEVCVLTHYHAAHVGSFEKFVSGVMVRALWLPEPVNEDEYYVMCALWQKAAAADVPVFLYAAGDTLPLLDRGSLTLDRRYVSRAAHPVVSLQLDSGQDTLLYCGASYAETQNDGGFLRNDRDCSVLILGEHGPAGKKAFDLPGVSPDTLVLSGKNLLRLSDTMLQRLPADCRVFLDTLQWQDWVGRIDNAEEPVIK